MCRLLLVWEPEQYNYKYNLFLFFLCSTLCALLHIAACSHELITRTSNHTDKTAYKAPFPLLDIPLHSGTGLLVNPVTRQVEVAVPFMRYPELHENIMVSSMLNGLVTSPDTWPLGMVGRGHVTTEEQECRKKNKFRWRTSTLLLGIHLGWVDLCNRQFQICEYSWFWSCDCEGWLYQ